MGGEKELTTRRQRILLFLREVLLTDLIVLAVTLAISWFLHRTTWYLFAEGLTIAGAAIMIFGAAGPLGFWNQTRSVPYQYGSMHTGVDVYDRIRAENKEAEISYRFMYLMFVAGSLLILLSILIHRFTDIR